MIGSSCRWGLDLSVSSNYRESVFPPVRIGDGVCSVRYTEKYTRIGAEIKWVFPGDPEIRGFIRFRGRSFTARTQRRTGFE
jgi:hypothetical protein